LGTIWLSRQEAFSTETRIGKHSIRIHCNSRRNGPMEPERSELVVRERTASVRRGTTGERLGVAAPDATVGAREGVREIAAPAKIDDVLDCRAQQGRYLARREHLVVVAHVGFPKPKKSNSYDRSVSCNRIVVKALISRLMATAAPSNRLAARDIWSRMIFCASSDSGAMA